jgi:hypothetical protein
MHQRENPQAGNGMAIRDYRSKPALIQIAVFSYWSFAWRGVLSYLKDSVQNAIDPDGNCAGNSVPERRLKQARRFRRLAQQGAWPFPKYLARRKAQHPEKRPADGGIKQSQNQ